MRIFLQLVYFKCMLRKLPPDSAGVNYGRSYQKGGKCGGFPPLGSVLSSAL